MNICRFSVTRPVSVIVFMMIFILFGYLSLSKLPVREYPNIETPTISVMTTYTGASSEIVETKITQILENAVAGIEGLDNISSTSKEGKSTIRLEFSINQDIDVAANDVRDRINQVMSRLPDDVSTPVVQKMDTDSMPVMIISVTSDKITQMELSDYVDRYIIDRFSVIDGVASVNMMGNFEQSMRIWLNRKEMAARKVTVEDVTKALRQENVEYPSGRLESVYKEYPITVDKRFNKVKDFRNLVVSKDDSGNFIRLGDIAKINVEPKSQRSVFKANDQMVITFGISKQSRANTLTIAKTARELVDQLQKQLPDGMKIKVLMDNSSFISDSINEVFISMLIAAVLVFCIVFVFIGSVKAALIPSVTVPISLISACMVLKLVGASINMLTLLAMVLAVGIVVDDAILVLENIQRRIDEGEPPLKASALGTQQVLFAVISTTVVLLAVFLPIGMLPGKAGKLFIEFSIAISSAVCFSSFIALTLTPMLCSKLLSKQKIAKFQKTVDSALAKSKSSYKKLLEKLLNYPKQIIAAFFAILVVIGLISANMVGEYEPKEDRNQLMIKVSAQEGTGLYEMVNYMNTVLSSIHYLCDENFATNILMSIPGFGPASGDVNSGIFMINLVDKKKRDKSVFDLIQDLNKKLQQIPGIKAYTILPMGISPGGSYPLQFILGGYSYEELVKWRDIILHEAAQSPYISNIDTDYKETTPKLRVAIDNDRAGDLGVTTNNIGSTLEVMLGSKQVTTFTDRGQEYDVILQSDKRESVHDISNIYVKSATSELISLDNLINIREVGEAAKLGRQNRTRSITISGNISRNHSLSEGIDFLKKVVKEKLPEYAQIHYKGQTKDYNESQGSMAFIFILALLVSYFVLAAQFESFVSPFVVMLTVPMGIFGALLAMYLCNFTINIYTEIGLIMLIGLSAKQGIIIVEFANQLRDEGLPFKDALLKASELRLRPIVMTGISTVIGAVPLLLATGASSASRQNLGVVEVFGGLSGVLLTLIIVPFGYSLFCRNSRSPKEIEKKLLEEERVK